VDLDDAKKRHPVYACDIVHLHEELVDHSLRIFVGH
jgi:hypothetical protein